MKLKVQGNFKTIINYIILVIVSSALIASILVALPLTEKISEEVSFNLITSDSKYWSKEYSLKLKTNDSKEVTNFRNILFKRLKDFNVERISITKAEATEEDTTVLRVVVDSSKDQKDVERLIKTRFHYEIVTRKTDVDFENEEEPYTIYMADNYQATEWNWEDFRNIHITSLRTTAGSNSYFALYKQWPKQRKAFQEFLNSRRGETIGVNIDGFVTPFEITRENNESDILFALPIYTAEAKEAEITSILYNSGHIPVEYTVESEKDLPVTTISVDYIKISIGLIIAIITTYLYILIFKQAKPKDLLKSLFATTITLSIYITILKVQHIPVYTLLLAVESIITAILIRTLMSNKESQKYILFTLFAIYLVFVNLGSGFIHIFAKEMSILTFLAVVSIIISNWYIGKIRKI